MTLRELKTKDAPLMLEWMHDDSVTHDLQTDFASKTMDDALSFINNSLTDDKNLNLAITDDNDEYMGTVSLKHIDGNAAEFAITVRSCAMGGGSSLLVPRVFTRAQKQENLRVMLMNTRIRSSLSMRSRRLISVLFICSFSC